jgi:hypothetical protein
MWDNREGRHIYKRKVNRTTSVRSSPIATLTWLMPTCSVQQIAFHKNVPCERTSGERSWPLVASSADVKNEWILASIFLYFFTVCLGKASTSPKKNEDFAILFFSLPPYITFKEKKVSFAAAMFSLCSCARPLADMHFKFWSFVQLSEPSFGSYAIGGLSATLWFLYNRLERMRDEPITDLKQSLYRPRQVLRASGSWDY